jgi:hypothetical protein
VTPFANEDVMWERLKDIQREVENHRLYGTHRPTAGQLLRSLGRRLQWFAGRPNAVSRALSRWSAG